MCDFSILHGGCLWLQFVLEFVLIGGSTVVLMTAVEPPIEGHPLSEGWYRTLTNDFV